MNMHAQAAKTYGYLGSAKVDERSAEYQVIAGITSRLQKAHNSGPIAFVSLAASLTENRRLWTEFAIDIANVDNSMPPMLKKQIMELAIFTLRHTEHVISGAADADVLIEINLAIMRGLSGKRAV